MTPRGLLLVGSLVALAAVLLAAAGAAVQGPQPPSCRGFLPAAECRDASYWGGLAIKTLALPVGVLGAVLVGMGLARRAAVDDALVEAEAAAADAQPERPEARPDGGPSSSPRE